MPAAGGVDAQSLMTLEDTMLTLQAPAYDVVVRSAVVYVAVLVGLRLAGKREIGQLTIFDLLVLLLLANAVQNAMVGSDTSLTAGLVSAGVLLLLDAGVAGMRMRSPRLRKLIQGSPTVLVLHGSVMADQMAREGLDQETLEAAFREHGVDRIDHVEMAVLEIDGSISVIPMGQDVRRLRHPRRMPLG
jgi:uncharacterized membrane protein YcaP (DUF421 family)